MEKRVILAQTDTTVGFLSQYAPSLEEVKKRPPDKQFLRVTAGLAALKKYASRIPNHHKHLVRRSKKTTFIIKGSAFRVVTRQNPHYHLVKPYGWLFSTSANESGKHFERSFCEAHADIIVEDNRGLHETSPSTIYKLGRLRRKRLR